MKTMRYLIPVTVLALALFAGLLGSLQAPVTAAPAAAPTPAASINTVPSASSEAAFYSAVAVIADGNSAAVTVKDFELADIQYVIDQGDVNTVTLKLQFSNDNAHWTDGAALVSANAADADTLSQQAVFGKFARINADVANTSPVTVTVLAVLK